MPLRAFSSTTDGRATFADLGSDIIYSEEYFFMPGIGALRWLAKSGF